MRHRPLIFLALAIPAALAAQSQSDSTKQWAVRFSYSNIAGVYGSRLVAAFDSIPAAKYEYRPMPSQQTIGHIAQHIENANYGLCGRFGSMRHAQTAKDALPDSVKDHWPKDTLIARLRASLRFCDTALDRADVESAATTSYLIGFETDLAEHYSQLSVYMRLLGMVPPSALPPQHHTAIALSASALSAYVGEYRFAPGMENTITVRDGVLNATSTMGRTVRLVPEAKDRFFVEDVDAVVSFTRNGEGAVTGLVLHQYDRDRPALKIK